MRKVKLFFILLLILTMTSFTNLNSSLTKAQANDTPNIQKNMKNIFLDASTESVVLTNATIEPKDVEELKAELEVYIEELKVFLDLVKVDSGKPLDKMPFWHQIAPKEVINNLKDLVEDAERLLENEEASEEDLVEMKNQLLAAETDLKNNITTGTQESDYTNLIIIVGSSLVALLIIGGLTIFILSKKGKKIIR